MRICVRRRSSWPEVAVDSGEALRGRPVKPVYPAEQLLEEARKLAHRIVDNRSPVTVALTRQMLCRNAAQPHPVEAHRIESLAMFHTGVGDGKEGVRSLLEKRPPEFASRVSTDLRSVPASHSFISIRSGPSSLIDPWVGLKVGRL